MKLFDLFKPKKDMNADKIFSINLFSCILGIVLCLFVIPAGVSFAVSEFMRKKEWIKFGDQKLEN